MRGLSHTEQLEELGIELVYGDIRDPHSVIDACKGMDIVIHMAAALKGSPEFMLECSVKGTKNIAGAAHTSNLRRVVYLSSMSVYDYVKLRDGDVITEDSPLEEFPALRGTYSQAKRQKISRLSTLRAIHQLQETKSVAHVFRHRAEHRLLLFHFRRGFGFIFIGITEQLFPEAGR